MTSMAPALPKKSGYMMKKGSRVNTWLERYFTLRGPTISYYLKDTDSEAKGLFTLTSGCKISEIRSDMHKKRKQFMFTIMWPVEEAEEKEGDEEGGYNSDGGANKGNSTPNKGLRRSRQARLAKRTDKGGDEKKEAEEKEHKKNLSNTKIAMITVGGVALGAVTAGIGLLAGMVVVGIGAAAGSGAAAVSRVIKGDRKTLQLACDSYHDTEEWVNAFEQQIRELALLEAAGAEDFPELNGVADTRPPTVSGRLEEAEKWANNTEWRVWSVEQGIRVFELDGSAGPGMDAAGSSSSSSGSSRCRMAGAPGSRNLMEYLGWTDDIPCLRVETPVHGSNTDVFMALINMPPSCRQGPIRAQRVVETLDNYTDVVHLMLRNVAVSGLGTAPRDFCLMRYWKQNADGSYVVCLDSTQHEDCPVADGYVRGQMHAVYLVAPPLDAEFEEDYNECLVTLIAQMDPCGWVWRGMSCQHNMLCSFLLHVLDLRDTTDAERFVPIQFDAPTESTSVSLVSSSVLSNGDDTVGSGSSTEVSMGNTPPCALCPRMWSVPDHASFRLRGKTYLIDKVKANSLSPVFELIAVDLFLVPKPTYNIASHPKSRVSLAKARGDNTWVFVVNIMVPGPPDLCFVAYMKGKREDLKADTPFGRIANPFFFGSDDNFRNNRFKLIPKIVDGPFMLKMAVKDTPALIGKKLKQQYFKGENYFELDVDVGSSSVAKYIVGMAIGASKIVVVDMGFCLQGEDEEELPEVLMGAVTCDHIDCGTAVPI